MLSDNMFVLCRHTLVLVSVGHIELRAEPHEVASHGNSGYVHTVPDSETERRRKCTG